MIVVSDTSPICYLILIEQIDLLPRLYGQVVIPQAVRDELTNGRSPDQVQQWIAQTPDWLKIQSVSLQPDAELETLDVGEQSAILLIEQLKADLLIVDEMVGRRIARSQNRPLHLPSTVCRRHGRPDLRDGSGQNRAIRHPCNPDRAKRSISIAVGTAKV